MSIPLPAIEKNVPLTAGYRPALVRGRPTAPWRHFLARLEPGDSFRVLDSSVGCIRDHAQALGLAIVTQRTNETRGEFNTPWVRVWRI